VLRLPKTSGNVPTGGMKLTVARFFSPKGICYSGRGVVPHFIIDDPMANSESAMMGGPHLAKAIDELNRMTDQK
jgi:C-terminal processing protease CtpA/Prc